LKEALDKKKLIAKAEKIVDNLFITHVDQVPGEINIKDKTSLTQIDREVIGNHLMKGQVNLFSMEHNKYFFKLL